MATEPEDPNAAIKGILLGLCLAGLMIGVALSIQAIRNTEEKPSPVQKVSEFELNGCKVEAAYHKESNTWIYVSNSRFCPISTSTDTQVKPTKKEG